MMKRQDGVEKKAKIMEKSPSARDGGRCILPTLDESISDEAPRASDSSSSSSFRRLLAPPIFFRVFPSFVPSAPKSHVLLLLSSFQRLLISDNFGPSRQMAHVLMCEPDVQRIQNEFGEGRDEQMVRMQAELDATRNALAEKEAKVTRMSRMQDSVDAEVQELTEKLFQEAYKMVNKAEERREKAEKLLNESRSEMEVLRAEVAALKELVKAPGMGRNHFQQTSPQHKSALSKIFNSASSKKTKEPTNKKSASLPSTSTQQSQPSCADREQKEADAVEEVDPILFAEFQSWRDEGHPRDDNAFMQRVLTEEVEPCMTFENEKLSEEIMLSILDNRLELEPINEAKPAVRDCALTCVSRFCPYKIRTEDGQDWHFISLIARNRIAAVCDFYTCVRYLSEGLIRSGLRDSYFHVVGLRKNMALAKLGLGFVPKANVRPSF
ncbi:unnamed protein product [Caenorhabditis auriculariae]|uniref:GDP/GTP exchange factor Sec2 N-terminal domain-containing protein n=1 Tax=Caenorhabditis auriculariae TaxID=2777116 RepID=A0A8S1HCN9_9PELO|nr:unnamed protein product [Caenorhabditis auriculariae]